MPNTFTILGPSPAPPMVWDEITLCFDSDRPAGDLLKIIPLRPTELVSRSETRFNPLEHCQNPGFWTYKTEKSQSFDTEPLFRLLHSPPGATGEKCRSYPKKFFKKSYKK